MQDGRDPDPSPYDAAERWRQSLERVASAVASIRIDAPRPFDTDWNESAQATAFVIDAEAGLLLTNRHVVRPGPVVAEAVFLNHEEAPLRAIYRDPVHDFGVYRFDPGDLRFMRPAALHLAPAKAQVGTEIRVVGNDAGEKLSILAGTLARVDRPAPNYGLRRYNDFNTSYIQAASSTSGGSSGSPVVDIFGDVVALNAGSRTQAASSFFLPLDRVVRAVERIRRGEPVPRGTLTTTFGLRPYDELRRLGLAGASEAAMRAAAPESTSLLVVETILPGGPTDGHLELGDILIALEGAAIFGFAALEAILDAHVGEDLTLEIERGGVRRRARVRVADLHAITPSAFVEIGGAILHDLSYQLARQFQIPLRGVYLASAGHSFTPIGLDRGAVIVAAGGQPTPDVATLEAILQATPHGARLPLRFFDIESPRREKVAVITIDRCFFAMSRRSRDDQSGRWPAIIAPPPPPAPAATPITTTLPIADDPRALALVPALVSVDAAIPHKVDGVQNTRFQGVGLVVDHELGLVVVDRNTVPVALAELRVTFAGALEIAAELVFLHPFHNYAILRYDPALVGDTPIRAATLSAREPAIGEELWLCGLRRADRIFSQRSEVAAIDPIDLPLPRPPRYRAANLEKITLTHSVRCLGGALTDASGAVLALWASFAYQSQKDHKTVDYGLPVAIWRPAVEALQRGEAPIVWDPGIELRYLSLADARHHGLDAAWAQRIEAHDPRHRQALIVERVAGGVDGWQTGDIILAIAGAPATRFHQFEAALAPTIDATILRDGAVIELRAACVALSGRGTERIVHWAGALIQEIPRSVRIQRGMAQEGVYVSLYWYGSPASRSKLRAARIITTIDEQATPTLDALLAAVADRRSGDSLRLRTIDIDGKADLITIRPDLEYFPTFELRQERGAWRRIDLG